MADREHTQHSFTKHNVFAEFADMDAARAAIVALERAGVDGREISVLGPGSAEDTETRATRAEDASVTGDVSKKVAVGSAAGTAAGALAGLAAFAIPGIGPVLGIGIWSGVLGGAVAGGTIGAMAGGVAGIGDSEAWELAHRSVKEGRALVGVHSDDEASVTRADELLRGANPLQTARFDAQGRRIEGAS